MTDGPQFLETRPRDLHEPPPPWHRLAFIVEALPAAIARGVRELDVPAGGRVLDYGCADVPYRHLFPPDAEYLAADLAGNPLAQIEVAADGTVPVPDASCHAVISTQVLEHVSDPRVYLAECARVLRPGGRLLLSTHGLMVWHPDPVDLWRWTCEGLKAALADAGLEVVRFEGVMGLAATGFQLVQDAFYWRLPRRLRPALALLCQTLARIADRLEPQESRDRNAMVFAVVARRP